MSVLYLKIQSYVSVKVMRILYDPCVSTCFQAYLLRSGFVQNIDGNLQINGSPFVPVGFNAYWLGFTEEYTYPPTSHVDEIFTAAVSIGATVIRSHTVGFSSGSPNSLRPSDNTLNPVAWDPIDYAIYKATETGVKLLIPMTDAYSYYHGSYGDFCATQGIPKDEFWTNPDVRNDFKQYLSVWLDHVNQYTGIKNKDSPAIFALELGNELGNIREGAGSTSVPTQEWISDIVAWIKSIDQNHLVMPGTDEALGGPVSNDFAIPELDVFSAHFYGTDYSRIDYGADTSAGLGKPYIIGEYSSRFDEDWYRNIESRPNVKGTIVWSFYPHDNGLPSGNRVPHDDGFTVWYDDGDAWIIERLKTHFSNMKNRN